jgi:hypothetical protein
MACSKGLQSLCRGSQLSIIKKERLSQTYERLLFGLPREIAPSPSTTVSMTSAPSAPSRGIPMVHGETGHGLVGECVLCCIRPNSPSVAHAENHTRYANTPLAAAAFFNQTILPSKDKILQRRHKNEENATGAIHPRIRGVQESEIRGGLTMLNR